MKKNILIGIGVLIVALGLGYGAYSSSASDTTPNLSEQEIKDIVTAQYPGTITEVELDKKGSQLIYEVEIENGNVEYEIKLDGKTGEIIRISEKMIANIHTNKKADEVKETDKYNSPSVKDSEKATEKNDESHQQAEKDINPPKETPKQDKSEQSKDNVIGLNKAKQIAQNQFQGIIEQAELDREDGRLVYEIEIKGDNGKADFGIDAYTGEIVSKEIKKKSKNKKATKAVISEQTAIDIALKEFPGKVTEIELDEDDDRLIYEIEVKSNGQDADFDIDAYTGKIISIEIDND